MTLTQEIIEAIKSAPESVEWRVEDSDYWKSYADGKGIRLINAINYEWRIKPKPYEATHVVYLNKIPNPYKDEVTLKSFLFGDAGWQTKQFADAVYKYEITVREIVE